MTPEQLRALANSTIQLFPMYGLTLDDMDEYVAALRAAADQIEAVQEALQDTTGQYDNLPYRRLAAIEQALESNNNGKH